MNEQNFEQDSYKTGSTQPPKSRGGLVTVLFVAVILLCGISTALGIMNVRLFRKLQDQRAPMSFYTVAKESAPAAVPPETTDSHTRESQPELAIVCDSVSKLDQGYYGLPAGVYVLQVEENGCAAKAGIRETDIILLFDGHPVRSVGDLEKLLQDCAPGQTVEMTLYRHRSKSEMKVQVTLEDADD